MELAGGLGTICMWSEGEEGCFEARMMVQFLISENIEGGFRWIIDRSISKCEFLFAEANIQPKRSMEPSYSQFIPP